MEVYPSCTGTVICKSASSSSTETCSLSVTAGNSYYVKVSSYSGKGSYSLDASLSCTSPPTCDSTSYKYCSSAAAMTSGSTKSGMCGSQQYYKISTSKQCTVKWTMTPQTGTDYDLYVRQSSLLCPSTTRYDCRPYLYGSSVETCTATLPAGTYYAMVRKFSGTGSYSIKADVSGCVDTCAPHSYYSCYNNDVYWYNSCNAREDLKQDCGTNSCNSWGGNYCKNGDVYRSRTCNDRGCSGSSCYSNQRIEEQMVQGCEGQGCSSGQCIQTPGASIVDYTPYIENDYYGSVIWETTGDLDETGIIYLYEDTMEYDFVPAPINNFNRYAAIIAPKYQSCYVIAIPYFVSKTGPVGYSSDVAIMSNAEYCSASTLSATSISTEDISKPEPKKLKKNRLPKGIEINALLKHIEKNKISNAAISAEALAIASATCDATMIS